MKHFNPLSRSLVLSFFLSTLIVFESTLALGRRTRPTPIKLGGGKKVNRTVADVVVRRPNQSTVVLVPLSFLTLPAHRADRSTRSFLPSFLPSSRKRRKCPVVPNWPLSSLLSFSYLTISLKCQGLESQDSGLLRPSFVLSPPSFVTLFSHFSPRGI